MNALLLIAVAANKLILLFVCRSTKSKSKSIFTYIDANISFSITNAIISNARSWRSFGRTRHMSSVTAQFRLWADCFSPTIDQMIFDPFLRSIYVQNWSSVQMKNLKILCIYRKHGIRFQFNWILEWNRIFIRIIIIEIVESNQTSYRTVIALLWHSFVSQPNCRLNGR